MPTYLWGVLRYAIPLVVLLSFTGCGKEEPVTIRLTMEDRRRIDERVTATMDSLRPAIAERCQATYADRVAVATDSIVQRLLEDEARLRARIPQNLRR